MMSCRQQTTLDMDELSTTLIERRKRLHDLASEINGRIDESPQPLQQPPPPPQHRLNSASSLQQCSPSLRLNSVRTTPTSKTPTVATSANKENQTPTSNEILSVAKKILAKKQANSEPTVTAVSHSVKSIASKFEDMASGGGADESAIVQEKLTPRSIIQKFEKMASQSGGSVVTGAGRKLIEANKMPFSSSSSSSSINASVQTPKQPPSWSHNNHANRRLVDEDNDVDEDDDDGVESKSKAPRSIIEKFESLMTRSTTQPARVAARPSPASTHASTSTSLTYVSSVMMTTEAESGRANEYCDYDDQSETIMQKRRDSDLNDDDNDDANEEYEDDDKQLTSLFEDNPYANADDDNRNSMASTATMSSMNSMTGSSYTAEMISRSDYTDQDDFQDDQQDDYDSVDEQDDDNTTNREQTDETETTMTTVTTGSSSIDQTRSIVYPSSSVSTTGTSSMQSNTSGSVVADTTSSQPLLSLKDYRKQTKTFRSGCGRRRSSMAPHHQAQQQQQQSKSCTSRGGTLTTTAANRIKNGLMPIGENAAMSLDEQTRIAKFLERIKELEEFIRQEDNSIRQTKDAIECCLNDPQFTGSAQHIECNRLLLISCQKKQAYMTEANRLRSLVANPNKQPTLDTTTSDLTGLLIFSDLQIPVKESFLNKLKCGEEKRQYFFICLIRNGIQVLQTQVISTQELTNTNETSIVFPNRMALNNVDINFRIKIDIYEMEIQPKDQQQQKRSKHSSNHHQSKFFVSPFKNTNLSQVIQNTLGHHHNSHNAVASNLVHHGSNVSGLGAKTSNFIHIDTIEITKRDLNVNNNLKFKLNLSSSSIPLMGTLSLSIRCMPSKSIELKGFMTVFEEDMNGVGTWDRRWCFLSNQSISYWKYPEDEFVLQPLGNIYLTMCVNETPLFVLPRDLCARKHTIELLIYQHQSTANSDDTSTMSRDDILARCKRYRLSADTKEQANDWLTNLNYALANLRLWYPKAMKPIIINK